MASMVGTRVALGPLCLLKIQSEPKFESVRRSKHHSPRSNETGDDRDRIRLLPGFDWQTPIRKRADETAAFAATKSTRSVRRVTPRGVRSDGATHRLVERRLFVRSAATGSVACADSLCGVKDASGCCGN